MQVNERAFGRRDVVSFYARSTDLQPAETTIFARIGPELGGARLLDIGVGGGRTTPYLAPRVREYVGVDFSEGMVDACRTRFSSAPWIGHARFEQMDARDLRAFEDASFDVVVFSFNGIDYVDHEGRLRCLSEIRRVTRPGGSFVLSTHNVLRIPELFALTPSYNPVTLVERLVKYARLRANNDRSPRELAGLEHCVLNDGSYGFRSATYHVRPDVAVKQLEIAGFEDVRLFSCVTGAELSPAEVGTCADPWIYLLCRAGREEREGRAA